MVQGKGSDFICEVERIACDTMKQGRVSFDLDDLSKFVSLVSPESILVMTQMIRHLAGEVSSLFPGGARETLDRAFFSCATEGVIERACSECMKNTGE